MTTCTDGDIKVACPGDCNGDGDVTVELVLGINVAQESADVSSCVALDTSNDGAVTINELVAARNNILLGCGAD